MVAPINATFAENVVGEGRPDIVCEDEHRERHVLVELKFGAGLTENQPVNYLKGLPLDQPSALLVVAPQRRYDSLWQEMSELVSNAPEFTLGDYLENSSVRSVSVGNGRTLMLTSWDVLLNRMASRALQADDYLGVHDIRQLQGLVRQENDENVPVVLADLSPDDQLQVQSLKGLVKDAIAKGQEDTKDRRVATAGFGRGDTESYYAEYMSVSGVPSALGLFFGLWRQHGTPIWFTFQDAVLKDMDATLRKLRSLWDSCPEDFVEANPFGSGIRPLIRIHLREGERDEVVADIAKQLKRIADLLGQP